MTAVPISTNPSVGAGPGRPGQRKPNLLEPSVNSVELVEASQDVGTVSDVANRVGVVVDGGRELVALLTQLDELDLEPLSGSPERAAVRSDRSW